VLEGFLYRGQLQPAAWLDQAGSVKATFVYGTRVNVPEYMVVPTGAAAAAGTYRLVTDQVGSVRLVVNVSSGVVAERLDYDEFGNVLTDTNPGMQPFGFAGGLRDRDTGLTRFGARDYDSVVGRWTSEDPLRFDGGLTDFYSYVDADPTNEVDPRGLDVYRCSRVANIKFNPGFTHQWLKTDAGEGGLGACGGGVPGEGGPPDRPGIETCNNDHQSRASLPDSKCERVDDVDEACVNAKILQCRDTGRRWGAPNLSLPPVWVCWTYVDAVLNECKSNANICK
jgi:RHS repeat-associated protein